MAGTVDLPLHPLVNSRVWAEDWEVHGAYLIAKRCCRYLVPLHSQEYIGVHPKLLCTTFSGGVHPQVMVILQDKGMPLVDKHSQFVQHRLRRLLWEP